MLDTQTEIVGSNFTLFKRTLPGEDDVLDCNFRMRARLFVDELNWDRPVSNGFEVDQYDHRGAMHLVMHKDGRAIASSRYLLTDSKEGPWSYMIRDSVLGLIDGMDAIFDDELPTSRKIAEATRFCVCPSLGKDERKIALAALSIKGADIMRDHGVTNVLAMMSPAFIRFFSKLGIPTRRAGATFLCNDEPLCCMIADL